MIWAVFGLMMAMMWSRHWMGDGAHGRRGRELRDRIAGLEAELAGRDDAIALLEVRVNELESRLDFAERMLLEPKPATGQPG